MAVMVAILDTRTADFRNSESACPLNASQKVSAQSDLRFRKRWGLKNSMAAIFDTEIDFSNSESPCSRNASHKVSAPYDWDSHFLVCSVFFTKGNLFYI